MDEIHELVEEEHAVKGRYGVIIAYLQATSLFLKEMILDTLCGKYTPQ